MTYISSIISNYGDTDRVKQDLITLNDIMARQGDRLLLHAIAEASGHSANKFKMTPQERNNLMNALLHEFHAALGERL